MVLLRNFTVIIILVLLAGCGNNGPIRPPDDGGDPGDGSDGNGNNDGRIELIVGEIQGPDTATENTVCEYSISAGGMTDIQYAWSVHPEIAGVFNSPNDSTSEFQAGYVSQDLPVIIQVTVSATDADPVKATKDIIILDNPGITVQAGVSSKLGSPGESIHFYDDGSFAENGSEIISFEWDWENDGIFDETGPDATHAWNSTGFYNVQFRVTSADGTTGVLESPLDITIMDVLALTWGGAGTDDFRDMDLNAAGDVHVLGWYWDTLDIDPGPAIDERISDTIISVFFPSGDLQNAFRVGHNEGGGCLSVKGDSIDVGFDGNIYVCGDTFIAPVSWLMSGFLTSFNSAGDFRWSYIAEGRSWDDWGSWPPIQRTSSYDFSIVSDTPDGVILLTLGNKWTTYWSGYAGMPEEWDSGTDYFLRELHSSNGVYFDFHESACLPVDISTTNSGLLLILGNRLTLWIANDPNDPFTNQVQLADFFPQTVFARAVSADDNNNTYVTGEFSGTGKFGEWDSLEEIESNGDFDAFLSRYSEDGQRQWTITWGSSFYDNAVDIAVDGSGFIYITGEFSGTVDLDPGPGVFEITSGGITDTYLLKLDSDGHFIWACSTGGTGTTYARKVVVDSNNNIWLGGHFVGEVDLGITGAPQLFESNGLTDLYLVKLAI